LRPHEATALKTFCKQAQTIAIEPQELYQIASTTAKREHMTTEWIFGQRRLRHRRQTIHAFAHVSHPGGKPNPRSRRKPDHRAHNKVLSTTRNCSRSTARKTSRVAGRRQAAWPGKRQSSWPVGQG
jgi:hypothetical protein